MTAYIKNLHVPTFTLTIQPKHRKLFKLNNKINVNSLIFKVKSELQCCLGLFVYVLPNPVYCMSHYFCGFGLDAIIR